VDILLFILRLRPRIDAKMQPTAALLEKWLGTDAQASRLDECAAYGFESRQPDKTRDFERGADDEAPASCCVRLLL
jgi:hypothetical protein